VSFVRTLAALAGAAVLTACGPHEPDEVARRRGLEAALTLQVHDLHELLAKAEAHELATTGRVAIGVREDVASALLNASLPQEKTIAGLLRVRLASARPYFRGNQAAIVGDGEVQIRGTKAAPVELSAHLSDLRVESGTLTARFEIERFEIKDSAGHRLADAVLEPLVRRHLGALNGLLPTLEIPVHLEQAIAIDGLDEGVVRTRSGALPLQMTVAKAVPLRERLWVMIDVQAGPWQARAAAEPAS
jgi:hypothetical protein